MGSTTQQTKSNTSQVHTWDPPLSRQKATPVKFIHGIHHSADKKQHQSSSYMGSTTQQTKSNTSQVHTWDPPLSRQKATPVKFIHGIHHSADKKQHQSSS